MTNYAAGHLAEKHATEFLENHGYKIMAINWRTRYCEIDIIAKHKNIVYFVEVKYRKTPNQGTGLEYITNNKIEQMKFAADMWVNENNWQGDYRLSAIELAGDNYEITGFLPALL